MQSLFDDTKNPVFVLMCRIVNEIQAGAKLTRKDILNRIFLLPEFVYTEAPEVEREEKIVDTLFNFNRAGFAEIPSEENFSLPISDTELCWLRTVLADEELFFLLPDALRKKLLNCLKDFPPLYEKNFWRKLRVKTKTASGKIFSDKLAVIVEALRLQKKIFCDKEILTPCRLEYDLFADKYALIVWRETAQRVEKIPVENLGLLALSNENISPDVEGHLKKFYAEHAAEVSLKVENTRNAVERCFALFSSFDKKSRLQDDGSYFLTITYCTLDEEEIFEKILSLGAMATVISPKSFRERIIKRFIAIKNLYA